MYFQINTEPFRPFQIENNSKIIFVIVHLSNSTDFDKLYTKTLKKTVYPSLDFLGFLV